MAATSSVELLPTLPVFSYSGRWTCSPTSSMTATWCGASITFLLSDNYLAIRVGPQTERKDKDNGGTAMLACTISNASGDYDTRTYEVASSHEIVLLRGTDQVQSEGPPNFVQLTMIDWASVFELEKVIVSSEQSVQPSPPMPNRMLVIGDSICCGYTDGTQPLPLGCLESFPFLTQHKLRDTIGLELAVDLVAFPGWTLVSPTAEEAEEGAPKGMAEKFFHVSPWDTLPSEPDKPPAVMLVALGTNDEWTKVAPERFMSAMRTFVAQLVELYKTSLKHVCLIHPFVDFSDPAELDLAAYFPALVGQLVEMHGTAIGFHQFGIAEGFQPSHAIDGIHPTKLGYELLAGQLIKSLIPLFN